MKESEKKAYDYLKKYIKRETFGERNLEGDIKIILKLIEKQQKEIEKLKDEYKREVFEHQEFIEDTKVAVQDYIEKYKIKDIISEFIPESTHEVELRTKIIKLLGETNE